MSLFQRDDGQHSAEDVAFAQKFGGDARLLDGNGARGEGQSQASAGVSADRERMRKGVARKPEHAVYGRRW